MTGLTLAVCRCQCTACCDYFGNVVRLDRHRIGDCHAGRRCLTVEELASRGWLRNARGCWFRPRAEQGPAGIQGHVAPPPATHVGVGHGTAQ
jgi:hypothetical protein